jgi:hypothetical protein
MATTAEGTKLEGEDEPTRGEVLEWYHGSF